jgi:diaminopimelate epimerase
MLHFYKYQATGNDFILMDNREGKLSFTVDQIKKICDRKFGIGADGLILIEKDSAADFRMVYYNSDGSQSLCGNGCRSAIDLASRFGMVNRQTKFSAYDGLHDATMLDNGLIRVRMNNVNSWQKTGEDYFIHTGSPHVIRFVKDLAEFPVVQEGRSIRYSKAYQPGGTNVNFVELLDPETVFVRTYERGVEDETLSCGTGVTAVALAAALQGYSSPVSLKVIGGELSVEFKFTPSKKPDSDSSGQLDAKAGTFQDIFLIGPAKMVFEGDLDL